MTLHHGPFIPTSTKLAQFLLSSGYISCSFLLPALFDTRNKKKISKNELTRRRSVGIGIVKPGNSQGSKCLSNDLRNPGSASNASRERNHNKASTIPLCWKEMCWNSMASQSTPGTLLLPHSVDRCINSIYPTRISHNRPFSTTSISYWSKNKPSAQGKGKPGKGGSKSPPSSGKSGKPSKKKAISPQGSTKQMPNAAKKGKTVPVFTTKNDKQSNWKAEASLPLKTPKTSYPSSKIVSRNKGNKHSNWRAEASLPPKTPKTSYPSSKTVSRNKGNKHSNWRAEASLPLKTPKASYPSSKTVSKDKGNKESNWKAEAFLPLKTSKTSSLSSKAVSRNKGNKHSNLRAEASLPLKTPKTRYFPSKTVSKNNGNKQSNWKAEAQSKKASLSSKTVSKDKANKQLNRKTEAFFPLEIPRNLLSSKTVSKGKSDKHLNRKAQTQLPPEYSKLNPLPPNMAAREEAANSNKTTPATKRSEKSAKMKSWPKFTKVKPRGRKAKREERKRRKGGDAIADQQKAQESVPDELWEDGTADLDQAITSNEFTVTFAEPVVKLEREERKGRRKKPMLESRRRTEEKDTISGQGNKDERAGVENYGGAENRIMARPNLLKADESVPLSVKAEHQKGLVPFRDTTMSSCGIGNVRTKSLMVIEIAPKAIESVAPSVKALVLWGMTKSNYKLGDGGKNHDGLPTTKIMLKPSENVALTAKPEDQKSLEPFRDTAMPSRDRTKSLMVIGIAPKAIESVAPSVKALVLWGMTKSDCKIGNGDGNYDVTSKARGSAAVSISTKVEDLKNLLALKEIGVGKEGRKMVIEITPRVTENVVSSAKIEYQKHMVVLRNIVKSDSEVGNGSENHKGLAATESDPKASEAVMPSIKIEVKNVVAPSDMTESDYRNPLVSDTNQAPFFEVSKNDQPNEKENTINDVKVGTSGVTKLFDPIQSQSVETTAALLPQPTVDGADLVTAETAKMEQLITKSPASPSESNSHQQVEGGGVVFKAGQGVGTSFSSPEEEEQTLIKKMIEKYSKTEYPHAPPPNPSATKKVPLPSLTLSNPPSIFQQIYNSPHIPIRFKQDPSFWVYLFKEWYLPYSICQTLVEKPNEKVASAIFSNSKIPKPRRSRGYQKYGAVARDVVDIISAAKLNGVDILVELGKKREYSAVRWAVRRVLHPDLDLTKKENMRAAVGDVLGGYSHKFDQLQKEKGEKVLVDTRHEAERVSISRAGDLSLSHLIQVRWMKEGYKEREKDKLDPEKLKIITLSREGYGMVLNSICRMLIESFQPPNHFGGPKNKFWKSNDQITEETSVLEEYSALLPITKELLAYLHHSDLIPDAIFSPFKYPRLSALRTRILTLLADTVWRHQEYAAIVEAKEKGIADSQYLGFPLPRSEWRLHGYWRGGFESQYDDYPGVINIWDRQRLRERMGSPFDGLSLQERYEKKMVLMDMMERGEREVLLEFVLSTCIEAGYGLAGTDILRTIANQGGWSWVKYEKLWPEEYKSVDCSIRDENETTDGLPGRWGVRGYAVSPPPVRTLTKALPVQILNSMCDAILNSAAEGQGTKGVISGLSTLGRIFGKSVVSGYIDRVVTLWEDEFGDDTRDPATGENLLTFIDNHTELEDQTLEFDGTIQAELRVWYKVLKNYITIENTLGAIRVWNRMEERTRLLYPHDQQLENPYFHPPWILGPFLMHLVRNRRFKMAYSLLTPRENRNGIPAVPETYLHLPAVATPLLALAGFTKNEQLCDYVVSSLPLDVPQAVPLDVLTSMLSMYLNMGKRTQAQETIKYIREQGYHLDGVNMGILVNHALKKDKQSGYQFIQQTLAVEEEYERKQQREPIRPNLRVRSRWGNWVLPASVSASSFASSPSSPSPLSSPNLDSFILFEGQLIHKQPASSPSSPLPPPRMSPNAWTSVLSHAIDEGDRENAEIALRALGVDIRSLNKWSSMSTKVFNILLKGVVARQGSRKGVEMFQAHCLPPKSPGDNEHEEKGIWVRRHNNKGREWQWQHGGKETWGVRPDLVTVRTILDEAVRELERVRRQELWAWKVMKRNEGWLDFTGDGETVDDVEEWDGKEGMPEIKINLGEEEKKDTSKVNDDCEKSDDGGDENRDGDVDGIYGTLLMKEKRREKKDWNRGYKDRRKRKMDIQEVVLWCRELLKEMGGL